MRLVTGSPITAFVTASAMRVMEAGCLHLVTNIWSEAQRNNHLPLLNILVSLLAADCVWSLKWFTPLCYHPPRRMNKINEILIQSMQLSTLFLFLLVSFQSVLGSQYFCLSRSKTFLEVLSEESVLLPQKGTFNYMKSVQYSFFLNFSRSFFFAPLSSLIHFHHTSKRPSIVSNFVAP